MSDSPDVVVREPGLTTLVAGLAPVLPLVLVVLAARDFWRDGNTSAFGDVGLVATVPLVLAVGTVLLNVGYHLRFSVALRGDTLVVQNLRRTEIPATRIRAVQLRTGGSFRPYVVEVYDGERPITLQATAAGWKRNRPWTDQQMHLIGQWWLAHGGADDPVATR